MARKFHVEGTRTFFVLAVALLVVGLWSLKDGWYPAESTLKKHPMMDARGKLDHFYTFNRSLAVLSLVGSGICAYVHRVVR